MDITVQITIFLSGFSYRMRLLRNLMECMRLKLILLTISGILRGIFEGLVISKWRNVLILNLLVMTWTL